MIGLYVIQILTIIFWIAVTVFSNIEMFKDHNLHFWFKCLIGILINLTFLVIIIFYVYGLITSIRSVDCNRACAPDKVHVCLNNDTVICEKPAETYSKHMDK